MLTNQEKIRLPSEVPRHNVSNKRVDVRMSSRGQLGLENDNDCCLTSNDNNEQWTVYSTPSQTHEMGDVPIAQHPTCLKMRNEIIYGSQMAINSFQQEPFNGSCSRDVVKQKLCCNDIVNE